MEPSTYFMRYVAEATKNMIMHVPYHYLKVHSIVVEVLCAIALAFAHLTASGGCFPLALDAWLLKVFSASRLCKNAFLLDFTVESLKSSLE